MHNPFHYFNSSPEVIRLAAMQYVRYHLSLRPVEDLLFERGIDFCHETVRYWWNRSELLFAAEIRKHRVHRGSYSPWRWPLDEVFVRINGKTCCLWPAVDHEGEVLEVFTTKRRDHRAALEFLRRTMKRYGRPASIVTDRLQSYRAAMKVIGNEGCHGSTTGRKSHISPGADGNGPWRGSETSRPCRNPPPSMPRSTIISTTNAISTAATLSNKTEPLPWPSGVDLQPERPRL